MTILVAGLINIEVTLRIDSFPLPYNPVSYPFFGVNSSVSGVGYNIAKALTILGNNVDFLSLVGSDLASHSVYEALNNHHITASGVLNSMTQTPHSVILYDRDGRRAIHVDLKDIQEHIYPDHLFTAALNTCDLAVLCNINFTRPMLKMARDAGKLIATDVHAISDLDDLYNRDYMAHAHILFQSHERLPCSPEDWARGLFNRYDTPIVVVGLGAEGALLAVREDRFIQRFPAVKVRPVINTIGAGDALFSAFIHIYTRTHDPYQALQKAIIFASHKIGAVSAADGFLDGAALEKLAATFTQQ